MTCCPGWHNICLLIILGLRRLGCTNKAVFVLAIEQQPAVQTLVQDEVQYLDACPSIPQQHCSPCWNGNAPGQRPLLHPAQSTFLLHLIVLEEASSLVA